MVGASWRLFLTLMVLTSGCVTQPAQNRPNVVILFTDDQGTVDANCYGATDLETPHIDKLAATGVRFTQAYAHTVCCPARAALITGRHPQRSGVTNWTQGDMTAPKGINMALEEVTLAEALQAAGYKTARLSTTSRTAAHHSGSAQAGSNWSIWPWASSTGPLDNASRS